MDFYHPKNPSEGGSIYKHHVPWKCKFAGTEGMHPLRRLTFVGMGSWTPKVPELPRAWGYNWATRPQGDINSGNWPSSLGVGYKARDLTLENLLLRNLRNDLSEKAKTHKWLQCWWKKKRECITNAAAVVWSNTKLMINNPWMKKERIWNY
jgi:hypothetical protein